MTIISPIRPIRLIRLIAPALALALALALAPAPSLDAAQLWVTNAPAGSGAGDNLYVSFGKVNTNFQSLFSFVTTNVYPGIVTNLLTVDSIATLKNYDVSNGFLFAYVAATNGTGGHYSYIFSDTATASDGVKVKPTSNVGCWTRIFSGNYNAQWWGATLTNSTVQAAIDYVHNFGGIIDIPPGSWSIEGVTAPITVKDGTFLNFLPGAAFALAADPGTNYAMVKITGTNNLGILNGAFNGWPTAPGGNTNNTGYAVDASLSTNAVLYNLSATNTYTRALYAAGSAGLNVLTDGAGFSIGTNVVAGVNNLWATGKILPSAGTNALANQVLGMNNAATGNEYKSLVGGSGMTIVHAANTITFSSSGGAGGAVPTGTGFSHNTAGVQDGASKLVDTADINALQVTDAKVAAGISAAKIGGGGVSTAEFDFLGTVTSDVQTQLDARQPLDSDLTAVAGLSVNGLIARTATGTMAARTLAGTASEITVVNGDGVSGNPTLSLPTGISATKIGGGAVSSTEFDFLDGATAPLQAAIDLKAPKADPIFTGSLQVPNGTAPTTDAFGEIAGDNNAWASGRGAAQFYDGTAITYLIGTLASDTPSNGQIPTWNTGGFIDWQSPPGGGDALTSGTLGQFAATTSAALAGVLSDETGSGGGFVRATSPTLVTPVLGVATATSLDATTLTEGSLGVPNTGDKLSFFSATTSAELAGVLSDETGSGGGFARATSPTFVTPVLGVASATSLTTPILISGAGDPADAGVIRLGNAELIAWEASPASTDITLGVDSSEVLQASGSFNAVTLTENGTAVPNVGDNLSVFAATTSAQLAGVISDETGTGLVALQTSPVFVTPRYNGGIPTSVDMGTVAAAGTLTLVATTNIFDVIASGSTFTIALPTISIATNGYWLSVNVTNTSGGTQIVTIPLLFRKELKGGVTTITNLIGADATISFYAQNGAWHEVVSSGDALSLGGTGVGDALVANPLSQFAATTSAQFAGVISDETGTGVAVLATTPTLVTPVLGVATATSINKVAITAPASSATLTIADGKTATVNNSITFAGTDSTTQTFPATSGTVFSSVTKSDVVQAGMFAADAGSTDTYVATFSPVITAYVTGAHYRFKAATANTGAATININSVGAKTIVKVAGGITTALADNDIRAGQWVDLVYDGTNMQMQSLLGNAPAGSGDALVANPLSQFAATTSLQLKGVLSDETGSGLAVFATSPTFTTPVLGAATASSLAFTSGTILLDDAANILSQRNGVNGQLFYVYDQYTASDNYHRVALGFAANVAYLTTQIGSSGTDAGMVIGTGGATTLSLRTGNTDRWDLNSSGHLLGHTDNTYDIGASGATRPRSVYIGTSLTTPLVNKVTITAPATGSTLTIPDGVTLTGPASSGTAMTLGNTESVTGVKTFTTPVLGVASATTINKVTLTAPATGSTLTIADGKTLTATETTVLNRQSSTGLPVEFCIAASDETTAITAAAGKATFRAPYAFTLTEVRASVNTAPTGATILIDINESGTTVISTKLMIDATEKTSTTAATPYVISDAAIADDAEISIDFDQVGSTIAGAGVKVWLKGYR